MKQINDKTQEEIDALKEATRLAHEAAQELKAVTKEALAIRSAIDQEVANKFASHVEAHFGEVLKEIANFQQAAYDRILFSFDKYTKPLMSSLEDITNHIQTRNEQFGISNDKLVNLVQKKNHH